MQKTEFNVKNIRTKLSCPALDDLNDVLLPMDVVKGRTQSENEPYDFTSTESDLTSSQAQAGPIANSMKISNIDLYVGEVIVTLYEEDKKRLHRKNEIISVYLDHFTLFFAGKVSH